MNLFRAIGTRVRTIFGLSQLWPTVSAGGYRRGVGTAFDSVWAIGGVEAKGEAVASLPIKFVDMNGRDLERMDPTQKAWATLLQNPNQAFAVGQFWQLTTMLYEIDGTAFWVLQDENGRPIQGPLDIPSQIMVYGTKYIVPRGNASGTRIVGWDLRDGGENYALKHHQIVRFWRTNPRSYVDGLSISDKIGNTLELDKNAKRTNSNFFKNGARPSGILQATSRMDEMELRRFATSFSNDFASPENAGKIPALPKEIDFKQDQSVRDMDFIKLHENNRDESFGATRVPKFHLSVTDDINYATADVQNEAYWINVIQPMTKIFQDIVNSNVLLGTGMKIEFDFDKIPAIKLGQIRVKTEKLKMDEVKWRIANRMWRQGYPVNRINEYLDLEAPMITDSWANASHDPTLLGASSQPVAGESTKGVKANPFDNLLSSIKIVQRGEKEKSILEAVRDNDFEAMDKFCKSIETESIGKTKDQFEKILKSYFTRLKTSQIKRFDAYLDGESFMDKAEGEPRKLETDDVEKVLFSSEKWNGILVADTQALYIRAFQDSLNVVREELGGFTLFQPTDAMVTEEAKSLAVKVVRINETLRDRIRAVIVDKIEIGASRAEMTTALEEVFNDKISRVVTTARTETGIAMNAARYKAISEERPTKQWISANDSGVRESHRQYSALGSKPMDYMYNAGLSHPQDSRGSAGEVINCRCVLVSGQ